MWQSGFDTVCDKDSLTIVFAMCKCKFFAIVSLTNDLWQRNIAGLNLA